MMDSAVLLKIYRKINWRCFLYWLPLSLMCVLLDQLSKSYVLTHLKLYQSLDVLPWLNLTLILNKGAAFGWFAAWGQVQINLLLIMAISAVIGLSYWLAISNNAGKLKKMGLALVIGGALGNILDRCMYGFVIDFIDVYIQDWHWYIFNVADIAVSAGVTCMLLATHQPLGETTSLSSPVRV